MTREWEPDPEVIADLQLREQTARARPRNEAKTEALYTWAPPEIVAKWKCRTCGALAVPISADDLEFAAVWNRKLRSRGEAPLDPDRIVFCDACRDKHRASGEHRRAEERERIAEEIRKLKNADDPTLEAATIKTLRELGHPDVDGLVQSLVAKAITRLEKGRGKGKAKL